MLHKKYWKCNDCMFLSCHVRVSEWIHSLYLHECQGTPCSKQTPYLKFKWLQQESNPQPLSSAKWLSVHSGRKWLWVRVPLQSLENVMVVEFIENTIKGGMLKQINVLSLLCVNRENLKQVAVAKISFI